MRSYVSLSRNVIGNDNQDQLSISWFGQRNLGWTYSMTYRLVEHSFNARSCITILAKLSCYVVISRQDVPITLSICVRAEQTRGVDNIVGRSITHFELDHVFNNHATCNFADLRPWLDFFGCLLYRKALRHPRIPSKKRRCFRRLLPDGSAYSHSAG